METAPLAAHATARWHAARLAFAWCLVCFWLIGVGSASAQVASAQVASAQAALATAAKNEAGLPFIQNFSPAEYAGAPQNWSVIQDQRGVIYLGNVSDGLFAFDGSRWRRIPIPNRSAVRSLAMDASGRIYVGAMGDFGYLQPDAVGQMHFVSLLEQVPADQRQFTDVWKTLSASDGVYFETRTSIFRFANGVLKAWKAKTAFHMAFLVDDTVYVRAFDLGLMRMTEDGPVMVTGGERFANEKIYVLLPWKGADARPGELLIGTRSDGWWRFDGEHYFRWSDAADAATRGLALYNGIWLSNGQLALAIPPIGLLILDKTGRVVYHLNRANGLANNAVNAVFEDRKFGLWATTDVGVSRVAIDKPITTFDERNGLTGAVMTLVRYEGKLYVGTTEGLFVLATADSGSARFTRLTTIKGGAWSLLDSGHGLLVGGTDGLFSIHDGKIEEIRSSDPLPVAMYRSRRNPNRIFLGSALGLSAMRWNGGNWLFEGAIGDFGDEIRSMAEDDQGRLWLGAWNSNVLRITLSQTDPATGTVKSTRVERFSFQQGIPPGEVTLMRIDGEMRIGSSTGILSFDPIRRRFVPDPHFAHMFEGDERLMPLAEQDATGKLWMYVVDINHGVREAGGAARDKQGNWRWIASPLQPLAGNNMLWILPERDGVVWFSAEEGLFRYAPAAGDSNAAGFSTLLRAVATKDGDRLPSTEHPKSVVRIRYNNNALRFEFAAPSFDRLEANRFQTQMQGLDTGWSAWSPEAYRDYTNLPDGHYHFQVRAKNVYGDVGKTVSFEFWILAPWYRTWWAWTLWSALAAIGLLLVVFWRSTTLRRRNRTLIALVGQRTSELQAAVAALSEQSMTDPLTGLKNRRYLHDHIEQEEAIAARQLRDSQHDPARTGRNTDMAFLMVDIDYFKEVNDTHGHAAGDRVLQQMRDILLAAARDSDTPIRWGGEEFLILARFAKPRSGARLAERLRAMVEAHPFDLGNGVIIHRTCSIGFACYPFFPTARGMLNWEQVVNMADECMYAAKRRGRNAWVGVQAGEVVPEDVTAALRESLEMSPQRGSLDILLSSSP